MLGTNDMKCRFGATASDIALGVERVVKTAQAVPNYTSDKPFQILLVSPPEVWSETFLGEVYGDQHETSKKLPALYKAVAERCGVWFLDMACYAQASQLDGLHLDRANHRKAAAAMQTMIQKIIG